MSAAATQEPTGRGTGGGWGGAAGKETGGAPRRLGDVFFGGGGGFVLHTESSQGTACLFPKCCP